MDGNSIEGDPMNVEGLGTVVGKSIRRRGRPAKVVDLKDVRLRLLGIGRQKESLRHIARSLGMSHSTLREHLQRSGLVSGWDY